MMVTSFDVLKVMAERDLDIMPRGASIACPSPRASASAFTSLSRGFDNGGANNGRLRYIEGPTRMFHCALTWSLSAATANDQFVLAAFKNDALVAESRVINTLASAAIGGSAIHAFVEMATNDYIELFVGNLSGARNATIYTLNIFAMGMK